MSCQVAKQIIQQIAYVDLGDEKDEVGDGKVNCYVDPKNHLLRYRSRPCDTVLPITRTPTSASKLATGESAVIQIPSASDEIAPFSGWESVEKG